VALTQSRLGRKEKAIMKKAIVMTVGLSLLAVVVSARADEKKVDEKFCAAEAAFHSDIEQLNAVGPHTTAAEVHAVKDRIDNEVFQMQMAASRMKTPAAKAFLDATKQLDKDLGNIPDDATLQQAHARIQSDAESAQTAGRHLADEAGCPQMAQE
jgi:hypothetical protein